MKAAEALTRSLVERDQGHEVMIMESDWTTEVVFKIRLWHGSIS
jgi:hypothetical protein